MLCELTFMFGHLNTLYLGDAVLFLSSLLSVDFSRYFSVFISTYFTSSGNLSPSENQATEGPVWTEIFSQSVAFCSSLFSVCVTAV